MFTLLPESVCANDKVVIQMISKKLSFFKFIFNIFCEGIKILKKYKLYVRNNRINCGKSVVAVSLHRKKK